MLAPLLGWLPPPVQAPLAPNPSPRRARAPAKPPLKFPNGFSWGVATSGFQIEGAVPANGRGPSIWDTFCERTGAIADVSSAVACDHYDGGSGDLDLMRRLGINS